MATRLYALSPAGGFGVQATTVTWAGLLNGDNGQAIDVSPFQDKSVQIAGVLGGGGVVEVEGALLGSPASDGDWRTLNDPQGNILSITMLKLESVLEHVRWVRPRVSAGDGTTNLTVHIFLGSGARG